jgi:hypothetical protein
MWRQHTNTISRILCCYLVIIFFFFSSFIFFSFFFSFTIFSFFSLNFFIFFNVLTAQLRGQETEALQHMTHAFLGEFMRQGTRFPISFAVAEEIKIELSHPKKNSMN